MIKQNSFVPYPEAMLPKGFKYPQSYLKLAHNPLMPLTTMNNILFLGGLKMQKAIYQK